MTPFFDTNLKVMNENIVNCNIKWQGNIDAASKVSETVHAGLN